MSPPDTHAGTQTTGRVATTILALAIASGAVAITSGVATATELAVARSVECGPLASPSGEAGEQPAQCTPQATLPGHGGVQLAASAPIAPVVSRLSLNHNETIAATPASGRG